MGLTEDLLAMSALCEVNWKIASYFTANNIPNVVLDSESVPWNRNVDVDLCLIEKIGFILLFHSI